MNRAFCLIILLFASCAAGGETATQPDSRSRPAANGTIGLPVRETLEALAFAPSLGWHLGGIYAFIDAPGRRVQVYESTNGGPFEVAGLIDRAGQVYGAVMWSPADGFALQGGADGSVLYITSRGFREFRVGAKLEGRYVRIVPASEPNEKGENGSVFIVGSDKSGKGSILLTKDGSTLEETFKFDGKQPKHLADFTYFSTRRFAVGGSDGKGALYRCDDGHHYKQIDVGDVPNLLSIHFDAAGHGLAVGDNGECLRSSDGGLSWKPALSGTDRPLASVAFVSELKAYICGRDGVVLYTSNGGASFEPVATGRRDDYFKLQLAPGGGAYAIGARGVAPFLPGK
ncbi:MAG: hypothetical protein HY286_15700 [Planctomycetes bacterium]|nr:hypothetical protein [Planctomycetota bacterium]